MSVIAGRNIVVTGAANGIGAALAAEAARKGAAHVTMVDVSAEELDVAVENLSATGASVGAEVCDVTDADAVHALAARVTEAHGVPGLVCANAGVGPAAGPLVDASIDDMRWVLEVNVVGVLTTLQSFARRMVAEPSQNWLMATASEHALGVPHIANGMYTSSKHAVLGMCDVMRRELPDGVGVSVLCPGLTTSELWRSPERRSSSFGGPGETNPVTKAVLDRGMSPALVATRALDGVDAGAFLIATHYNALDYAIERAFEVEAAFERLAKVDTSLWHVNDAIGAVVEALGNG